MMKKSCVIIDDEPLARNRLLKLSEDIHELEVLGFAKTGKEAVHMIDNLKPDIIFLDIQLKDMNGFDVLNRISSNHRPIVIFVTAFDHYAVLAFDSFAVDYLLKPYKKVRFIQAVNKAFHYLASNTQVELKENIQRLLDRMNSDGVPNITQDYLKRIVIKTGNITSFIDVKDIKYIIASGSYSEVFCGERKHVLRNSLNKLLQEMDSPSMIRIHRSTIVNLGYIDKLVNSSFGEIDVKMKDGKLLRVSKSYKRAFKNKLGM